MSLPQAFSTTGLHTQHNTDTPITRYQVLGERSSGTNFVKRLIGRNSPLKPTEALGWKHSAPHMLAIPHDMAVICAVRRADTWAQSMFQKPWHTTPAMQALSFSDFIRAEWDTIIDRPRYFEGLVMDGSQGSPLQADRDPLTGARYENLFALRRAKLNAHLSMLGRNCTCIVVRTEDAQSAPEATLDAILTGLGHPARSVPFRPVVKRLGSKFKAAVPNRPEAPADWSPEDHAFLRAQTDKAQEDNLGYSY
ncbi:MAG: hypothetical protein ABJP79_09740 [Tateyamaria sp.]|uniref:hypothetical protein n=1 Tax=Tateyamaria sp. TaxID=1929288 RepID=UPI00329F30AA